MTGKALQLVALATVPGRDVSGYMSAVHAIPMLSAEEERELAEKYVIFQDVDAARRLIMAHLRFVVYIAKSYSGYGLSQADIIQEGNIGLMKAVKRFDPSLGVRLVSFAVHWIKAEIHEFVLKNWRIVKVATTKAQRKLFFNLRRSKKTLGLLTESEIKNVASGLKVLPSDVREMEGRLLAVDTSFDGLLDADTDDKKFVPSQYLEDADADPALQLEQHNWEGASADRLYQALDQLDARSRDILESRWLVENKLTLHELAEKYHISAERIRQIEKQAMQKLQESLVSLTC